MKSNLSTTFLFYFKVFMEQKCEKSAYPFFLEVKTERQTEEANLCSIPSGNAGGIDTAPQGEFTLLFPTEHKQAEPDVNAPK